MNIKNILTTHVISISLILFGFFIFFSTNKLSSGLEKQSGLIEQMKTAVIDTCSNEEVKDTLLSILNSGFDASFYLIEGSNVLAMLLVFLGIINVFITKSLINKSKV